MKKDALVGFFDSGVGGLTVLYECKKLLANENFIYLSDTKNAPYGLKTDEQIKKLSFSCVERLLKNDVKAVVVACNTATNVAIEDLRQGFLPLIIVGVEPAINLAVRQVNDPCKNIIVLTTLATSNQNKFLKLVNEAKKLTQSPIIVLPQNHLASVIEKNINCSSVFFNEVERIFCNIKDNVGAVVLGCTHYVYLRQAINDYFGGKVSIFDGNEGTAKRLKNLLIQSDLINDSKTLGKTSFIVD